MSFNVLRNADIYNSVTCIHDSRVGYKVVWPENNNLNGYSDVFGVTSHTTWDGIYSGVTLSGSAYISSAADFSFDASVYTLLKVKMRIDVGKNTEDPTLGRIEYQTSNDVTWDSTKQVDFLINPDNAYHTYTVDMSSKKSWQGSLSNLRVYPIIDGQEGTKFYLKYLEIASSNSFACDSPVTGAVCSKFSEYAHVCPWTGKPGISRSVVLPSTVSITENVNDKLIININDYGDQSIKLRPVVSGRIIDVARDIQDKLNLVGVGGYALARCYVDNNTIVIEAGTRSASSTVIVLQPNSASAARSLGFFGASGKVATELVGEEPASRYETAPLKLNSTALKYFRQPDRLGTESSFEVDSSIFSPQAGNSNYKTTIQETKLIFRNKTVIDYDNPVTQWGILTKIAYSGDAYTNTFFRVYRQKLDGSFTLIHSVDMSVGLDKQDQLFEQDVSLVVHKGDLLSLYSAALHTGKQVARPSFSYILYDGDLITGTNIQELSGRGERGLPIFARGELKTDNALLDIEFENPELLESITVRATEDPATEEVNLCTVRNGGLLGGPFVTSSVGTGLDGAQAPAIVNLTSLIDGDKQNVNTTSTYTYPGSLDLPDEQQDNFDLTDFSFEFDFAKGVDTYFNIYKIKMYFVEDKNIKDFKWEVPLANALDDSSKIWGIGWPTYNTVLFDGGLADANADYVYDNPAVVTASNYRIAHEITRYNELVLQFDPYKARSIKYTAGLGDFLNEDPSSPNYSVFPIAPDPRIQEIEIFGLSTPAKSIVSNFEIESSKDGEVFLLHNDFDELSSSSAKYIIGRPVRFLRMGISSDAPMKVFDIYGTLSEGPIGLTTNAINNSVNLNAPITNSSGVVQTVDILNEGSTAANFFIDIADESFKAEKCILWNKLGSDEEVEQSEIGSGGIFKRRDPFYLRPYNYAYKAPGYFLDVGFVNGKPGYISLDEQETWQSIGSKVTDGSETTFVTNENPLASQFTTTHVVVDLEQVFDIASVTVVTPTGFSAFFDTIFYSSSNVDNPVDIPGASWNTLGQNNARWLRFTAPSVNIGDTPNIRKLAYIQVALDLTSVTNKGKLPWRSAEGNLTNGVSGYITLGQGEGWIENGQSNYFAVDLGWWHNVTNVITGPLGVAADDVEDIDINVAGTFPSILSSDISSSSVAYSASSTTDPSLVVWGSFGDPPDGIVKWVLINVENYRVEEIIVQVESNNQNAKISFLDSKWWTSSVNSVYSELVETRSGLAAAALGYQENTGPVAEYMLFSQSMGIDKELAKRDVISFWLFVSDISEIDSTYGYFELGRSTSQNNTPININLIKDTSVYYRWNWSDVYPLLEEGWNFLQLPFSDNFRKGDLFFAFDDRDRSGSYNVRDRITNFRFDFKGISNNNEFTIRIDDLKILRKHYATAKFGNGIYLPNSEYLKFPLSEFDPTKGTIEFFIKPDWTKSPMCNSCDDPREHTILRVYNSVDNSIMALLLTGEGLKFYVSDGDSDIFLRDNTNNLLLQDVVSHLAITWDFDGIYTPAAMSIYINGRLSSAFNLENLSQVSFVPNFSQRDLYTLMFGGTGWAGIMSSFASGVNAVIDNVRVYNYPIRDFTASLLLEKGVQPKRSPELITVSSDNSNFFGIEDRGSGLPLFIEAVPAGARFSVYVRGRDLSETKDGEKNRISYLDIQRTVIE